jgi:hypothetical protein
MSADWYVASFTAHPAGGWRGALYVMHPDAGPELILECGHDHLSMKRATACAERELAWSRRVVALADERRPS